MDVVRVPLSDITGELGENLGFKGLLQLSYLWTWMYFCNTQHQSIKTARYKLQVTGTCLAQAIKYWCRRKLCDNARRTDVAGHLTSACTRGWACGPQQASQFFDWTYKYSCICHFIKKHKKGKWQRFHHVYGVTTIKPKIKEWLWTCDWRGTQATTVRACYRAACAASTSVWPLLLHCIPCHEQGSDSDQSVPGFPTCPWCTRLYHVAHCRSEMSWVLVGFAVLAHSGTQCCWRRWVSGDETCWSCF